MGETLYTIMPQVTHKEPEEAVDHLAFRGVRALRWTFDVLAGFKTGVVDEHKCEGRCSVCAALACATSDALRVCPIYMSYGWGSFSCGALPGALLAVMLLLMNACCRLQCKTTVGLSAPRFIHLSCRRSPSGMQYS